MTRRRAAQQGYTLVELTITVSLLMLVIVPTLMSLRSSERSANDLRTSTEVRAQVRFAIDALVRDFRQAQTGTSQLKPVASTSANSLTFYSPDRSVPYRMRKITYTIAGSKLNRSVTTSSNAGGAPWLGLSPAAPANEFAFSLVSGSTFVTRNASGAPTTNADDVKTLDVTLVVNGLPRPGAAQTFRQSVEIRTAS